MLSMYDRPRLTWLKKQRARLEKRRPSVEARCEKAAEKARIPLALLDEEIERVTSEIAALEAKDREASAAETVSVSETGSVQT